VEYLANTEDFISKIGTAQPIIYGKDDVEYNSVASEQQTP
jgi:hypothetical protein